MGHCMNRRKLSITLIFVGDVDTIEMKLYNIFYATLCIGEYCEFHFPVIEFSQIYHKYKLVPSSTQCKLFRMEWVALINFIKI